MNKSSSLEEFMIETDKLARKNIPCRLIIKFLDFLLDLILEQFIEILGDNFNKSKILSFDHMETNLLNSDSSI